MSDQLQIESPQFDQIRKGDKTALVNAINLLWLVANNEISVRAETVQRARDQISPKVLQAAPTTQQDNFDAGLGSWILFTGGTAFNWTGIRNGIDGRVYFVENIGAGTVTIKFESASSDAANRFYTSTGADVTLATGKTTVIGYHNSRWRVASFI